MRSRVQSVDRQWLLAITLLVSMGMSGCQVGRTFFQMDSNTPVPFMGVDLLPKRDRSSPTEGVSRFQDEQLVSSTVAVPAATLKDETPSRLTRLLGRSPQPQPLALPNTNSKGSRAISTDAPVEAFR